MNNDKKSKNPKQNKKRKLDELIFFFFVTFYLKGDFDYWFKRA